jgi:hypothetical protein
LDSFTDNTDKPIVIMAVDVAKYKRFALFDSEDLSQSYLLQCSLLKNPTCDLSTLKD